MKLINFNYFLNENFDFLNNKRFYNTLIDSVSLYGIDYQDNDGNTILNLLIDRIIKHFNSSIQNQYEELESIKWLLNHDADPNIANFFNETPLIKLSRNSYKMNNNIIKYINLFITNEKLNWFFVDDNNKMFLSYLSKDIKNDIALRFPEKYKIYQKFENINKFNI